MPPASSRISSENVAEKSRFWRLAGSRARIAADVADEAHVEHSIGFVEDEDLDRRQVDRGPAGVVEQPARRGDHDLGAVAQSQHLRLEADAAVDRRRADGLLGAVRSDALLDLEGELASRRQDEAADRQPGGAVQAALVRGGRLAARAAWR